MLHIQAAPQLPKAAVYEILLARLAHMADTIFNMQPGKRL